MQSDKLNGANTLMLTPVLRALPNPRQCLLVCSSGSKGYCALKEMLQNGTPGHTLLIESGDLRDVSASSTEGCCLLVYYFAEDSTVECAYSDHIPSTVRHVVVYANMVEIPSSFLERCSSLLTLDLSTLSLLSKVRWSFLSGCTGLTKIDLNPLSQVTMIQRYFLEGCTGLTALDLSPLSQITIVDVGFLQGCTGLTTVDLSPLSQVTVIPWHFLQGCTGLTALNLRPFSLVTEVQGELLEGCTGINTVDNPPPLCEPPEGWSKAADQWIRD